jgi:hypothetical protein
MGSLHQHAHLAVSSFGMLTLRLFLDRCRYDIGGPLSTVGLFSSLSLARVDANTERTADAGTVDTTSSASPDTNGEGAVPWELLNKGLALAPELALGTGPQSADVEAANQQAQQLLQIQAGATQQVARSEHTVSESRVSDAPTLVSITAVARVQGQSDSSIVRFNIVLDRCSPPTYRFQSPESSGLPTATEVVIAAPEADCDVHYTVDGSRPVPGTAARATGEATITVNAVTNAVPTLVRVVCTQPNHLVSDEVQVAMAADVCHRVDFATLDAAELALRGGLLGMSCKTEGATIYYTTNGTPLTASIQGVGDDGNPVGVTVEVVEGVHVYSPTTLVHLKLETSSSRSATVTAVAVKEGT